MSAIPAVIGRRNQHLSPHFTLAEMSRTTRSIDNWPAEDRLVANLRTLCIEVLEDIRVHAKRPLIIHSGYRCPALNRSIGGSTSSQHMKGEAADFHVPGISNLVLAQWISENLDFDQLILENFIVGQPNSGWVHCSYSTRSPLRNQALTKFRGNQHYFPGLRTK